MFVEYELIEREYYKNIDCCFILKDDYFIDVNCIKLNLLFIVVDNVVLFFLLLGCYCVFLFLFEIEIFCCCLFNLCEYKFC